MVTSSTGAGDWSDEFLNGFFADPEAIKKLDPTSAKQLCFVITCQLLNHVWSQRPPSNGLEPLFVQSGFSLPLARGLSELAVRHGKRQAMESKWHRPVHAAIRFLGGRERQSRAILSRAKILLEAAEETSIIAEIFGAAGLLENEFISLLRSAVDEGRIESRRITEIAADLSPFLSSSHGPKISAPSAAYEFLLRQGTEDAQKRERFCSSDALAEAIRREFALDYFDGRPARRRLSQEGRSEPTTSRPRENRSN
jgi:hypothetical protein